MELLQTHLVKKSFGTSYFHQHAKQKTHILKEISRTDAIGMMSAEAK